MILEGLEWSAARRSEKIFFEACSTTTQGLGVFRRDLEFVSFGHAVKCHEMTA
jgi:hypothetical protein